MGPQETAGHTKTMARLRAEHAQTIAASGGIEQALTSGALPRRISTTLSEAVVLGLLRQQVTRFLCVLGHGSTEIAEVLRIYEDAKLVETFNVRHETAASHAAAALRWVTGERAAVVTSIGPGALQALAGSLVPASDGLGVWYLFGDETTEDEGPNMQQIPKHEQNLFLRLCATLGDGYSLHTPGAVGTALRRGLVTVDNPHRPGPFYLLLPMNTQAVLLEEFNLDELPCGTPPKLGAASDESSYQEAAVALINAERVVVKVGGGARDAGPQLAEFLELVDGVAVLSPLVTGVIPYAHPRNMLVGGSKGTKCGNHAMEKADLLVAIGTRSVCQSDSSRTGYPNVTHVININSDVHDAMHYSKTTALVGDAGPTLVHLMNQLKQGGVTVSKETSSWLAACRAERDRWIDYKQTCFQNPTLYDEVWKEEVLTQPAVIKAATDWARAKDVVTFFDAGDVQAHGFQIVEDDRLGRTFTETGASYMGFATSALLATALASQSFYGLALTGDGSFTMNPQILIDGIEHGVCGCVLVLDNRRMAAISALQVAQYQEDHATSDSVEVDYIAWARSIKGVAGFDGGRSQKSLLNALDRAFQHPGLSLVSVPVYYGPDPRGGLGAYGRWNVGNWVSETQALRHTIGI